MPPTSKQITYTPAAGLQALWHLLPIPQQLHQQFACKHNMGTLGMQLAITGFRVYMKKASNSSAHSCAQRAL